MSGKRGRRPGGQLNYLRRGEGEPLLLIHSLGGSIVMWVPVLDRLASEHEVVAVDMPGFGDSVPLPDGIEPSAANLATAVLEFYDSLALPDPHIAGISLGGWVAIECARQGRVRSVVGLCPAGFWRRPLKPQPTWLTWARLAGRASLPVLPLVLRTERGRRRALGGTIHHPERLSPDQALRLVRGYIGAPAYPQANALMRGNMVGAIDDLEPPVTLAWAQYDRLVRPPRDGVLPKAVRQVSLPGCGHVPTWDDPGLVARVILEGSAV